MDINTHFLENMKQLLGKEFEEFIKAYDRERFCGIRVNRLKITVEEFLKITPFKLKSIPWTVDGFYIDCEERPAKHPHYHMGLYYIQEPSAMLPASLLTRMGQLPNKVVLDLCASPGGKTIQLAAAMENSGLLITNDISSKRIKPLIRNIEQYGVKNAVILNGDHDQLSACFEGCFNAILVDAPCSGEGMFRKDAGVLKEWDANSNDTFSAIQKDIASRAIDMLAPGGDFVYSTCTFSPKENEEVLSSILEKNASLKKVLIQEVMPENVSDELQTSDGYGRVWPHKSSGEGHFAAMLSSSESHHESPLAQKEPLKQSDFSIGKSRKPKRDQSKTKVKDTSIDEVWDDMPQALKQFVSENMCTQLFDHVIEIGNKLYVPPMFPIPIKGLPIVRMGWYIGDYQKGRFEPSPSFAMGMSREDFKRVIDLPVEEKLEGSLVIKYLKGDTLFIEGENGYNLICYQGYPLGFGKLQNGVLKNMYHPAWRLQ